MTDDTTSLLRGLSHPLRRDILKIIYDSGDQGISPKEAAKQLAEPLSNVSYHVRALVSSGLITLARTEPVRGSLAHFYVCVPAAVANPHVRTALGLGPADS